MAPLEAMAQGCPVIYSNRCSGPELIDHGRNGLLIDPDSPEQIAGAIVGLLRDDEQAARLGAAGREDVARRFASDVLVARNEAVLLDLHPLVPMNRYGRPHPYDHAFRLARRVLADRARSTIAASSSPLITATPKSSACSTACSRIPDPPGRGRRRRRTPEPRARRASSATGPPPIRRPSSSSMSRALPVSHASAMSESISAPASTSSSWTMTPCRCAGYFAEMRRVFQADRERRVGGIAGCVINEMDRPVARRWQLRFALGLVPRLEPMIYHPSGTHTPAQPAEAVLRRAPHRRDARLRLDLPPRGLRNRTLLVLLPGLLAGRRSRDVAARRARWTLLCCGDARILHLPAAHGRPVSYTRGRMEMRNRYFVWKRHTPRPAPRHVAASGSTRLLLIAMDVAWFCVRPWKIQPLGHALGTDREMARA